MVYFLPQWGHLNSSLNSLISLMCCSKLCLNENFLSHTSHLNSLQPGSVMWSITSFSLSNVFLQSKQISLVCCFHTWILSKQNQGQQYSLISLNFPSFECIQLMEGNIKNLQFFKIYRVSHNWVLTLFCLFSRLPMLIQRFILPFFNSPGDDDSKTHLTFLPISKIDQVTEQNVEQPWFRYNLDKPCMYQNNNI